MLRVIDLDLNRQNPVHDTHLYSVPCNHITLVYDTDDTRNKHH